MFVPGLVVALSLAARARADDREEADLLRARAEAEEARFELEAAHADYAACARAAPSGRWASMCAARAADLGAHSEGGFAPLTMLERARHGLEDAHAIDALATDAASFPDGPVRGEAHMLCAEAYLDRLGREDDGLRMLDRVAADTHADVVLRRFASRREADLLLARGRHADAASVAARSGDPELVLHVARATRRHRVHLASIALLAIVLAGALRAVVSGLRARSLTARLRPARAHLAMIAAFAAFAGLGGAALSLGFERGHAKPFLALGAATAALGLVARTWAALGEPTRAARAARATLCALCVLGTAFLILERIDVRYLEGFGL